MPSLFSGLVVGRPFAWERHKASVTPGGIKRPTGLYLGIFFIGFILRVWVALAFPSLHQPDEIFQAFEPAHLIAFGYGIESWEWHAGLRSPVIPYALAAFLWIGKNLTNSAEGYRILTEVALALFSMVSVVSVMRLGLATSPIHGAIAGIVAATWFEAVYFSCKPFSEVIATTFLISSASMALDDGNVFTRSKAAWLALYITFGALLRIQLFPAFALVTIWAMNRHNIHRSGSFLIGVTCTATLFGLADWIFWGRPFLSFYNYLSFNMMQGRSADFGVAPFHWYMSRIASIWGPITICILLPLLAATSKSRSWMWISLVILGSHMLIAHKEYRFIYPATICMVIGSAFSAADVVQRWTQERGPGSAKQVAFLVGLAWVASSAWLSAQPGYASNWFRKRESLQMANWMAAQDDLCGLLILDLGWADLGGYTYLDRDIPLYSEIPTDLSVVDAESSFNYVVLEPKSLRQFSPAFKIVKCIGSEVCVARRSPGVCSPQAGLEPLTLRKTLGQNGRGG